VGLPPIRHGEVSFREEGKMKRGSLPCGLVEWIKASRPRELGGLGISHLRWAFGMRCLWFQKTEPNRAWSVFPIQGALPHIWIFFFLLGFIAKFCNSSLSIQDRQISCRYVPLKKSDYCGTRWSTVILFGSVCSRRRWNISLAAPDREWGFCWGCFFLSSFSWSILFIEDDNAWWNTCHACLKKKVTMSS